VRCWRDRAAAAAIRVRGVQPRRADARSRGRLQAPDPNRTSARARESPMAGRSGLAPIRAMPRTERLTPNTIRGSVWYITHKYIGSLFGDHIDGSNDEIAGNARKDRRIDNPEIPNAVHTEFAVDYPGLIFRFHRTRATGMVAPGVILDM